MGAWLEEGGRCQQGFWRQSSMSWFHNPVLCWLLHCSPRQMGVVTDCCPTVGSLQHPPHPAGGGRISTSALLAPNSTCLPHMAAGGGVCQASCSARWRLVWQSGHQHKRQETELLPTPLHLTPAQPSKTTLLQCPPKRLDKHSQQQPASPSFICVFTCAFFSNHTFLQHLYTIHHFLLQQFQVSPVSCWYHDVSISLFPTDPANFPVKSGVHHET